MKRQIRAFFSQFATGIATFLMLLPFAVLVHGQSPTPTPTPTISRTKSSCALDANGQGATMKCTWKGGKCTNTLDSSISNNPPAPGEGQGVVTCQSASGGNPAVVTVAYATESLAYSCAPTLQMTNLKADCQELPGQNAGLVTTTTINMTGCTNVCNPQCPDYNPSQCTCPLPNSCASGDTAVCQDGTWVCEAPSCDPSTEPVCPGGGQALCQNGVWTCGGGSVCLGTPPICSDGSTAVCTDGEYMCGGSGVQGCESEPPSSNCYCQPDGTWACPGDGCDPNSDPTCGSGGGCDPSTEQCGGGGSGNGGGGCNCDPEFEEGCDPSCLQADATLMAVITNLSPSAVQAGNGGFSLAVFGSNFNSGSVLQIDGSNRATTVIGPSLLMATIPASDIASMGILTVSVNNPSNSNNSGIITSNLAMLAAVRKHAGNDFDGDGKTDLGSWTPSTGNWWVWNSSTRVPRNVDTLGQIGDIPVVGDFDGDGKADAAVWRPTTGQWIVTYSSTGATVAIKSWGVMGDIPVSGDFDGDGKTDLAIWRPSTGQWWLALSSQNYAGSMVKVWGVSGDIPVVGDYDGDGKADLGIWRPSTGQWWLALSSQNYAGSMVAVWGVSTDIPVAADFDGDGKADLGFWRPSTGEWWIAYSSQNYTGGVLGVLGSTGDVPAASDYDGDGKADMAVWEPSANQWLITASSRQYPESVLQVPNPPGAVPVPSNLPISASASSSSSPPSSGYAGYLDVANCSTIAGWAWNSSESASFINVDIYAGSTLIATVPANLYRSDLPGAGIGNGYHAFSLPTPASLQNGVSQTISADFGGTTISLSTSPKTLTCSSNPAPSISSISPTSAVAGGAGFTLTINGANFVNGVAANIVVGNGSVQRATTFVSSTQLTVQILSSDIATSGTQIGISVANPLSGGGYGSSSNQVFLAVQ
jgi:hypothetical protein